jgi:hypothetical protein
LKPRRPRLPPVRELVQNAAASPDDLHWLDDVQRGGELDEARRIAWRQVKIDDRGQAGLSRVDREVGITEQTLIGAGIAEGDAPGEGLPALDVEPDLVLCHHGPPGWAVADRRRGDHDTAAGAKARRAPRQTDPRATR